MVPIHALFRQTVGNDWPSVVHQLNIAIDELFQLEIASLASAKGLK